MLGNANMCDLLIDFLIIHFGRTIGQNVDENLSDGSEKRRHG